MLIPRNRRGLPATAPFYSMGTDTRQPGVPPTRDRVPQPVRPTPEPGPDTRLQYLPGIGPQRARLLAKLGLETVRDALFYLPARHEDRTRLSPLRSVAPSPALTATGGVRGISPPPRRRARAPLAVLIGDGTGFLTCVWFNQPYLERVFERGQRLIVHGKVQRYGSALQMQVKDYEIAEAGDDEPVHTGRLVPVYRLTQGLTQRPMRTLMKRLVDCHAAAVADPGPPAAGGRRDLGLADALRAAHFPASAEEQAAARRRLVFDDFFLFELGLAIRRHREGRERGLSLSPPGALAGSLLGALPYRLT